MSQRSSMIDSGLVGVSAFRFSDDPSALAGFLQAVGLRLAVSNDANSWLELTGASGRVCVHSTDATEDGSVRGGSTEFVPVCSDVTAVADALDRVEGVEVSVWDEAFGRQASVRVAGRTITLNETQNDLYGYREHAPQPSDLTVAVHWHTAEAEVAERLLTALGLTVDAADATGGRRFRSDSPLGGLVYVHPASGPDLYDIEVQTDGPISRTEERLRGKEIEAITVSTEQLILTDPDGQRLVIRSIRRQ